MGIWSCAWETEAQIRTSLIKEVLRFCQHVYTRVFCRCGTQSWNTRWNRSHSLSVFSSLALHWNSLTSARNFDQQGKFHLHCCKIPLVRQLRMHLLMDLHKRSCDIYTLTLWDCDSNFGETGSYISRPFQLRSMQWWGNTVNNLKSFYKWHLKMPLGLGKEDRTFI